MKSSGSFPVETTRLTFRRGALGLAVLALAATQACTTASAASLSTAALQSGDLAIVLDGEIANGDGDAVEALMKETNDRGRLVAALRLDSPGGSLAESVKIAELVQRTKIAVVVGFAIAFSAACTARSTSAASGAIRISKASNGWSDFTTPSERDRPGVFTVQRVRIMS